MPVDLLALLAIVTLSVALVAAVSGYLTLKSKMAHMEEEEDALRQRSRQKARHIIDHAQEAAFQIANEAIVKAEESKHLVHSKLEEVAAKQLREYQAMIHGSSDKIQQEVSKMMALKMDEEWGRALKEIEAYKDQRKKEIDQKTTEALKHIAQQVLGKSIDISTHTQLVTDALEAAKKEYGF